jgi:uncharacterized protein with FMN-binding domain
MAVQTVLLVLLAASGLACFGSLSAVNERDLKDVPDGQYIGRARDSRYEYGVVVSIRDGQITSVAAPLVARGPAGTKSRQVLSRVVEKQSTDVDTISGATRESAGLLRAIENAVP